MAVQTRVRKLANPRRRVKVISRSPRRNRKRRARNPLRRKLSLAQIRAGFGGKRRQAALKARKKRKNPKRRARARNASRPRVRVVTKIRYRTRKTKSNPARRRKARRRNPAPVIVTLGATNPRRKSMAKRRKKNAGGHRHRRARARSRNPRRIYVARKSHRNRRARRSRNPLFGGTGSKHMLEMVGGGLLGMAGTKFLPTLAPASLTGLGGSTFGPIILSGASAFVMKFLAGMVKKGGSFQDAVFFGGLIQTGSVTLNALFPSLASQFGLGALMDGHFVVPQNPLRRRLAAPGMVAPPASSSVVAPTARINMNGLGRAFSPAF